MWNIRGILSSYFFNVIIGGLKMKNKLVVISLLAALLMTAVISLTGYLEDIALVPFLYAVREGIISPIIYLIVLDIVGVVGILSSMEAIAGWMKGKGTYAHFSIRKSPKNLLIGIVVTLGFNLLGVAHSIIFKAPLDESVFMSTILGLMIVALIILLFTIMMVGQRPAEA